MKSDPNQKISKNFKKSKKVDTKPKNNSNKVKKIRYQSNNELEEDKESFLEDSSQQKSKKPKNSANFSQSDTNAYDSHSVDYQNGYIDGFKEGIKEGKSSVDVFMKSNQEKDQLLLKIVEIQAKNSFVEPKHNDS